MKNLILKSFINSLVTLIYILGISLLMTHADNIFGKMTNFLGPVAFLLLFTISALIVGTFILGKPIMLYLDNQKKESIQLLLITIGWLALFTIVSLVILILIR